MIKLIASDIDGTLVEESSHNINPEYFKVIEDRHPFLCLQRKAVCEHAGPL